MAIAAGSKAPPFKLYNTDRKEISSEDFTGKTVILHFFPAAFTRVCTEQVCSNRDDMSYYSGLDAVIIGISVDMPFSLKAFKEAHNINFELLSDFNKRTIHDYEMYHCNFILGLKGVAKRGVVVIDKNGMVAYSEETPHTGQQVNFQALKEVLSSLK
jgi:glutaredoxin-dependent peroxiredoxin